MNRRRVGQQMALNKQKKDEDSVRNTNQTRSRR
jgi:hypothetical protein